MSQRSKKIILFFLTIFALQMLMLLVVVLRPKGVSAQETTRIRGSTEITGDATASNCPCSQYKDGIVKLFVPIPGVTDGCGYLCDIDKNKKADIVDYVVAVYKFLIGIAAVLAVLMIMYGGYLWIFAAGNSSTIQNAKETIMSAMVGLVLALASVQILQTINPRLVNVSLPDIQSIDRITSSGETACGENDIMTADENFNTVVTAAYIALRNSSNKSFYDWPELVEYHNKIEGAEKGFKIKQDLLFLGNDRDSVKKASKQDILDCDNTAKSYRKLNGEIFDFPSGPEVKIASIQMRQPTTREISSGISPEAHVVTGIKCFFGLCDPDHVDDSENQNVARANRATIMEFIKAVNKKRQKEGRANLFDLKYITQDDVLPSASTSADNSDGGACFGTWCSSTGKGLTSCLITPQSVACSNVKEMCTQNTALGCADANDTIESMFGKNLSFQCVVVNKALDLGKKCDVGIKFGCPLGTYQLVNYLKEPDAKDYCFKVNKKTEEKEPVACDPNKIYLTFDYKTFPLDTPVGGATNVWAVSKEDSVCCNDPVLGHAVCHDGLPFNSPSVHSGSLGGDIQKAFINPCGGKVEGDGCTLTQINKAFPEELSINVSGKCKAFDYIPDLNNTQSEKILLCQPGDQKYRIDICFLSGGFSSSFVYRKYPDCKKHEGFCMSYLVHENYPCIEF